MREKKMLEHQSSSFANDLKGSISFETMRDIAALAGSFLMVKSFLRKLHKWKATESIPGHI